MEYLTKKVGGRSVLLHRWVWEQANGPIPDGYVVHHVDHDKRNNALSNLELMTCAEHAQHHNQRHPVKKPCVVCGKSFRPHPTKRARAQTCSRECFKALAAKLSTERYSNGERDAEIRSAYLAGERPSDLAARFDLSRPSISRITAPVRR